MIQLTECGPPMTTTDYLRIVRENSVPVLGCVQECVNLRPIIEAREQGKGVVGIVVKIEIKVGLNVRLDNTVAVPINWPDARSEPFSRIGRISGADIMDDVIITG